MRAQSDIIVVDCDGVLVSYPEAYEIVWERAFGEKLVVHKPGSYHATTRYGVEFESDAQKSHFFSYFTDDVWANMPPLPGSVLACEKLVDAGYELVCVTAMPEVNLKARKMNLAALNFPIRQVIATGCTGLGYSKTSTIHGIMPVAFVDDLATNFIGVKPGIHTAFIDTKAEDAPDPHLVLSRPSSIHRSLADFANWWLVE